MIDLKFNLPGLHNDLGPIRHDSFGPIHDSSGPCGHVGMGGGLTDNLGRLRGHVDINGSFTDNLGRLHGYVGINGGLTDNLGRPCQLRRLIDEL